MAEMRLASVRRDLASGAPVILLQETVGRRALPIFIGVAEAQSMLQVIQGEVSPRPLTYELFVTVLGEAGVTLERVVVTELVDKTFFAELHLLVRGERRVVSARPSDAVNLALRAGCPIFCDDDLLAAEGVELDPGELDDDEDEDDEDPPGRPEDQESLVSEFNKFIENLKPEDFA